MIEDMPLTQIFRNLPALHESSSGVLRFVAAEHGEAFCCSLASSLLFHVSSQIKVTFGEYSYRILYTYRNPQLKNTVLGYKKGLKIQPIFEKYESMKSQLSNAL